MRLLAIDTATQACSVALLDGEILITRYEEPGRGHAELILPMVDEVLKEGALQLKALDCIAVGRGPGAFTGVRIAISVAQGLAFGAGLKIVPVSDLAALAQRVADTPDARTVVVCMDARMGEVYWAVFEIAPEGLVKLRSTEQLSHPDEVQLSERGAWVAAGTGWGAYPAMTQRLGGQSGAPTAVHATLLPRAHEIAHLGAAGWKEGAAVVPEQALPVYLRDRVTHNLSQKT
jgi:tRNA threonylcarbamoyladenosine biosynthesis protein TsaB